MGERDVLCEDHWLEANVMVSLNHTEIVWKLIPPPFSLKLGYVFGFIINYYSSW